MIATVEFKSNFDSDRSHRTLKKCLQSLQGDKQSDIPFMIWLLENPDSIFPLPGKINLYNHDCLHILLDRESSLFDEAFVIGFTMGSDLKTNRFHLAVFKILSNLLYPKQYKFERQQFELLKIAFDYGRKLKVKNINQIDFKTYENKTVGEMRKFLGIDLEEVRQCFTFV